MISKKEENTRKQKLKAASRLTREESMKVNAEFAEIEKDQEVEARKK